jgi:hypothetical protein
MMSLEQKCWATILDNIQYIGIIPKRSPDYCALPLRNRQDLSARADIGGALAEADCGDHMLRFAKWP